MYTLSITAAKIYIPYLMEELELLHPRIRFDEPGRMQKFILNG